MRIFKGLVIGMVLLVISGCGTETPPVNTTPELIIEPQIECKTSLCLVSDFQEWAYGVDVEDGVIPCAFDFDDVNFDVAGTYTATCTVTDSDGDSATGSVPIVITANTPPVVQLEFDDFLPVSLGEPFFFNEWVFGTDEEDGTLPCDWDFEGVDLETPGTYTATCTVTDADGDTGTASVPIKVEDKVPPKVQKLSSHQSVYQINQTIDFYSNIMITDNYDDDLDVIVDDSLVIHNTAGTYDVTYTVTDDAGNETVLVVAYTLTNVILPTFSDEITFDQNHIWIDYTVVDPSNTFLRLEVEVLKEDEPFFVDSFFDVGFEIEIPVPSDTRFNVVLTYTYELGDGSGVIERKRAQEIMSDSWELPELDLELIDVMSEDALLQFTYTDPDSRILDSYIYVYDGQSGIYDEGTIVNGMDALYTEVITLSQLFTNHEYHIELIYHYDLEDGDGIVEVVVPIDIVTDEIVVPIPNVANNPHVLGRIFFDFEMQNKEYITSSQVTVSVQEEGQVISETQVFNSMMESHVEFLGLFNGVLYQVLFTYEYDLRDGMGIQQTTFHYQTYTNVFEIIQIVQISAGSGPGSSVTFLIEINNPYDLEITKAYIEDIDLQIGLIFVSGDTYEMTIPGTNIIEGLNQFVITDLYYIDPLDLDEYSMDMDYNNIFEVFIVGDPI
jgi:hypothetical protein